VLWKAWSRLAADVFLCRRLHRPILLIVELDAMAPVGLRCGSRQGTTR
jgi:hypothetical protein